MRRPTGGRRRLPADLAAALPFAHRERSLCWARCRSGCLLVATAHGVWELPEGGSPVRHCWRAIEHDRCSSGALALHAEGIRPVCAHVFEPGSQLPDLVRALESGSRLIELAFTLPSGRRLRIRARTCSFEGTLVWTSHLGEALGGDPAADAGITEGLLARARREYGTAGSGRRGDVAPVGSLGT